ncbi:MAG: AMP-binding protein [Pseudomonadota bacterium]
MSCPEAHAYWKASPEGSWAERTFDPKLGAERRWFPGTTCNTCWNAFDSYVAADHGACTTLIHDRPIYGSVARLSFAEPPAEVGELAAVMRSFSAGKGNRVITDMSMVPQALLAMLASSRLSAIHSVVVGDFAAHEHATRFDDTAPKPIVSAACEIEPAPRTPGRDIDHDGAAGQAMTGRETADCVTVAATDPLYNSGTTDQPKSVVRDNGVHRVAQRWTMEHHYSLAPGEVFRGASDVGRIVGHSHICSAPLLHGFPKLVYESDPLSTPDAGALCRVIADDHVAALITAPTALFTTCEEAVGSARIADHDVSAFRTLFLVGERSDAATVQWSEEMLGRPQFYHWWQTAPGWAMLGNPLSLVPLAVKLGSPGVAVPDSNIRVLDSTGHNAAPGTLGNTVCKLLLPPSGSRMLWNARAPSHENYLEELSSFYVTSGVGIIDADGHVSVMARSDDIINVISHRRDGGGERRSSRHRRVRGRSRGGRHGGPAPARLPFGEGRHGPRPSRRGAGTDRRRGHLQDLAPGEAAAHDPLGHGAARRDAHDRGQRALQHPRRHRRPCHLDETAEAPTIRGLLG